MISPPSKGMFNLWPMFPKPGHFVGPKSSAEGYKEFSTNTFSTQMGTNGGFSLLPSLCKVKDSRGHPLLRSSSEPDEDRSV